MEYFSATPKSRKKIRGISFFLFIALGLIPPLLHGENTQKKPRQTAQPVNITQARWHDFPSRYKGSGIVLPVRQSRIVNQLAGRIQHIHVYPGDRVTQGDLLVTLDASLIEAELNKALAQLKQAQLDVRRLQKLAKRNLSSEDEISKARTSVEIAQADVDRLQSQYKYSRIHAGFDGIISQRLAEDGDVLELYSHILSLMDTHQLKIIANVSASIISRLHMGDPALIQCAGENIQAGIKRVYPSIDSQSQQGRIEIQWPNQQGYPLPGQLCQLEVNGSTEKRLMIPNEAIQYDDQGPYVFIADNQKARKQRITTGGLLAQMTEVRQGLQAGMQVITAGLKNLSDGQTITISAVDK